MNKFVRTAAAGAIAIAAVLAVAAPASAASQTGSITCGGTYYPRTTSDTTGQTRHTITSRTTGAVRTQTWPSGGLHSLSASYSSANWTIYGATGISSYSAACTN